MTGPNDVTRSYADVSTPSPTRGRDVFILGAGFSKAIARRCRRWSSLVRR